MPVTCPGCGKQYRDPAPGTRVTVKCTGCGQPFEAAAADAVGTSRAVEPESAPTGDAAASSGRGDPARLNRLRDAGRDRKRRRDYEIGEVIGKTFASWFSNIVPFTVLSAVVHIPSIGLVLWQQRAASRGTDPAIIVMATGAATLVNWLLGLILQAAVVYGVFQHLRRQRASVGACVATGVRRLLPVLGASITVGLVVGGPVIVAMLVAFAIGFPAGVLPIVLGCVVALVLVLIFMVTIPVIVVENLGVVAAMSRSQAITSGSRFMLFLTLVVFVVVYLGVGCVVAIPFVAAQAAIGQQFAQLAITIVISPLFSTIPAVVYHDLRVAKEGVSIEDLAKVFD